MRVLGEEGQQGAAVVDVASVEVAEVAVEVLESMWCGGADWWRLSRCEIHCRVIRIQCCHWHCIGLVLLLLAHHDS